MISFIIYYVLLAPNIALYDYKQAFVSSTSKYETTNGHLLIDFINSAKLSNLYCTFDINSPFTLSGIKISSDSSYVNVDLIKYDSEYDSNVHALMYKGKKELNANQMINFISNGFLINNGTDFHFSIGCDGHSDGFSPLDPQEIRNVADCRYLAIDIIDATEAARSDLAEFNPIEGNTTANEVISDISNFCVPLESAEDCNYDEQTALMQNHNDSATMLLQEYVKQMESISFINVKVNSTELIRQLLIALLSAGVVTRSTEASYDMFAKIVSTNLEVIKQDLLGTQEISNANAAALKAELEKTNDESLASMIDNLNELESTIGNISLLIGEINASANITVSSEEFDDMVVELNEKITKFADVSKNIPTVSSIDKDETQRMYTDMQFAKDNMREPTHKLPGLYVSTPLYELDSIENKGTLCFPCSKVRSFSDELRVTKTMQYLRYDRGGETDRLVLPVSAWYGSYLTKGIPRVVPDKPLVINEYSLLIVQENSVDIYVLVNPLSNVRSCTVTSGSIQPMGAFSASGAYGGWYRIWGTSYTEMSCYSLYTESAHLFAARNVIITGTVRGSYINGNPYFSLTQGIGQVCDEKDYTKPFLGYIGSSTAMLCTKSDRQFTFYDLSPYIAIDIPGFPTERRIP